MIEEKHGFIANMGELNTERGLTVFLFARSIFDFAIFAHKHELGPETAQDWVRMVGKTAAEIANRMGENPLLMVADIRRRAKQPLNGNGENGSVEKHSRFE